jgi:hypothetical protein
MSHQWTMSRCPEPRTLAPRGPGAPADPAPRNPGPRFRYSATLHTSGTPALLRNPAVRLCLPDPLCRVSSGPTGRGTRTPVAPAGRRRRAGPAANYARSITRSPAGSFPASAPAPAITPAPRRHAPRAVYDGPPNPGPGLPCGSVRVDSTGPWSRPACRSGAGPPPVTYLPHLRGELRARYLRGAGQYPSELGALHLGKPAGRALKTRQAPRAAVANESLAGPSATTGEPHSRRNVSRRRMATARSRPTRAWPRPDPGQREGPAGPAERRTGKVLAEGIRT